MRIRAAASSSAARWITSTTWSRTSSWAARRTAATACSSRPRTRQCGGKLVVTNGDQTDTICDYLREGTSYIDALRTRQFEPDAPNYTSRISGVINEDGSYSLSILKNFTSDRTSNKRFFYEYDKPVPGLGHFIHTYQCDGDPLPPFRGEPKCIRIEKPIKQFTELLWSSMNEQNKVSLFVRYIDLATGAYWQEIRNKHEEGKDA